MPGVFTPLNFKRPELVSELNEKIVPSLNRKQWPGDSPLSIASARMVRLALSAAFLGMGFSTHFFNRSSAIEK